MPKRKQVPPKKIGEEKRKYLTWNMMDNSTANDSGYGGMSSSCSGAFGKESHASHDNSKEETSLASESALNVSLGSEDAFDLEENDMGFLKSDVVQIYMQDIENSLFNINVVKEASVTSGSWRCVLGEFELKFSNKSIYVAIPEGSLPAVPEFKLYISEGENSHILSHEIVEVQKAASSGRKKSQSSTVMKDVLYWLVDTDLPLHCLEALKCKSFQVVIDKFDNINKCITLQIIGTENIVAKLSTPGEALRFGRQQNNALKDLMQYFYKTAAPDYSGLPCMKKHDFDELYYLIKERHMSTFGHILHGVQHPDLLPRLRPYQQQAITWMIEKEKNIDQTCTEQLHILYSKFETLDGKTLYFHKYAGIIVREQPCQLPLPPGGILGEEMGLGKTVEVLACILLNPRENLPTPDSLPVLDEPTKPVADDRNKKKKKKKGKGKKTIDIDFTDSDSDAETIIYSDLDGLALSGFNTYCNNQSENKDLNLKETDQSNDCDTENVDCVSDQKIDCDTNLPGPSGTQKYAGAGKHKKSDKLGFESIFLKRPEVKKSEFECLCGSTELEIRKSSRQKQHCVQCVECNLWQHAECVNYDLRDEFRGVFRCPHCLVASKPIPSGATLIISPSTIAHQWLEEIQKHVKKGGIKVFMYNGVHRHGFIQPQTLAKQDIVITTYETLRKELDYVDLPHSNASEGRKLRHAKRFMAIPSPMVAVQWWRICLDEAQMVECTTTKTAEMALRLSAQNRWCVTGTPIQKNINDLYGLVLFLGLDPYWVLPWWERLVSVPFNHGYQHELYNILTSVLWRTVKSDVIDQINIPKQTNTVHWLQFSPVEDHFYQQQQRDCTNVSMRNLGVYNDRNIKLTSLDRQTVSKLMNPLLRLRQACCHPQAVKGEFIPINKNTMTMEQLLESMIKKAKVDAEESHRALVAALNGEAGLHMIHEQFIDAVDKYREVLRSVEDHKCMLDTDDLQQLHAMYNLNEVLTVQNGGIPPTLRDHLLPIQIDELKEKYVAKALAYSKTTKEAFMVLREEVKQLQKECKGEVTEWWFDVVQWSIDNDMSEHLMEKIKHDVLENKDNRNRSVIGCVRTVGGLELAVHNHLSEIEDQYKEVLGKMDGLMKEPTLQMINTTVRCCLRPEGVDEFPCEFCQCDTSLNSYEGKLFLFTEKDITRKWKDPKEAKKQSNVIKRQGTWEDSEAEKVLRSILAFSRQYTVPRVLVENGTLHVKLLDTMKKEFKKLRAHWTALKEHVATLDELDMSTTRLRLRRDDEPRPLTKEEKRQKKENGDDTPEVELGLHVLEKEQLKAHKVNLVRDRLDAIKDLNKRLCSLKYLSNLAENQIKNPDGSSSELCPICQDELGVQWSVMQCGHSFCMQCIKAQIKRSDNGVMKYTLKCSLCRQKTVNYNISYVVAVQTESYEVPVEGSYSTKVEAVVRCLLEIQSKTPGAKSLVFSTWTDVLTVIAKALEENKIKYKELYSSGKFQENLTSFREDDEVTTLLLTVHSGANGLNLIEATHVLLVEPILNPAQELQAIGRVHRIGQTKPTFVHRFLMKKTIEQNMYNWLQSVDRHNMLEKSEESALTIGDLSSLLVQQIEDDREGVQSVDEDEGTSSADDNPVPGGSGL